MSLSVVLMYSLFSVYSRKRALIFFRKGVIRKSDEGLIEAETYSYSIAIHRKNVF